ncbi:MAG TPA: hypothetical protein VFX61_07560 [Micromonosporaceae bacterium]|nr:hypothetical protein [Micromonosporaceae bacterium]
MTEASIDDLLRYEEEPARDRRKGPAGPGDWLRLLLTAAALAAVTLLGLRLLGIAVSPVVVFAGFVALLILRRLAAWVAPPPPARAGRNRVVEDGFHPGGGADGLQAAVHRWQRRLRRAQKEPDRFTRGVQPVLADLVDERLRQRHGCTRASDPARAAELLGEPLWTLLAAPPTRPPGPRQYAAILAKLEQL